MDAKFHPAKAAIKSGNLEKLKGLLREDPSLATARSSRSHPSLLQCLALEALEVPNKVVLQDIGSWIWMPRRGEFELSIDGQSYTNAGAIVNALSDKENGVIVRDFVQAIPPSEARYVRVKAYNYGRIPEWHAGKGGEAWIFIDEILIQ